MKTETKTRKPVNAADYIYKTFVAGRPGQEMIFCEEAANTEIATAVYTMRTEADLSQEELATRIGTKKSAISRLEDADYEGHSLGILKRIAKELGYRVDVSFERISQQKPKSSNDKSVANDSRKPVTRRVATMVEIGTVRGVQARQKPVADRISDRKVAKAKK